MAEQVTFDNLANKLKLSDDLTYENERTIRNNAKPSK